MKKIFFILSVFLMAVLVFAESIEAAGGDADNTSPVYSEVLEFDSRIITVYGFKDEAELDARFDDVMKLVEYDVTLNVNLRKMKLNMTKTKPDGVLLDFIERNNFEYVTYFKYGDDCVYIYLFRKFRDNYYYDYSIKSLNYY